MDQVRRRKGGVEALEEERLVKAAQSGDRAAFNRLVLFHKDRVFNLCYRFLGDRQEATDAAQEVFVKVYRSIRAFRFDAAFTTWLYRITTNTCLNIRNSASHRWKKRTESLQKEGVVREIQNGAPSPESQLEGKQKAEMIQRAIDRLPEEQRSVVVLREIEGLSYEEIAEVTNMNVGTVKSRLSRGRLALRESLRSLL